MGVRERYQETTCPHLPALPVVPDPRASSTGLCSAYAAAAAAAAASSAAVTVAQGSSQTVRCGGGSGAAYVTLWGLGAAAELKVTAGKRGVSLHYCFFGLPKRWLAALVVTAACAGSSPASSLTLRPPARPPRSSSSSSPPPLPRYADWGASPFQSFGAGVAAAAKAVKAKRAAVTLVSSVGGGAPGLLPLSAEDAAAAAGRVANGVVNGAFESTRFKSKPKAWPLESGACAPCLLHVCEQGRQAEVRAGLPAGGRAGSWWARRLAGERREARACAGVVAMDPGLDAYPSYLSPITLCNPHTTLPAPQWSYCLGGRTRAPPSRAAGRWRRERCCAATLSKRPPTSARPGEGQRGGVSRVLVVVLKLVGDSKMWDE